MEHIRAQDTSSSPPIENSVAPLIQPDPLLLTPSRRGFDAECPASPSPPTSTANVQYTDKSWISSQQSLRSKLTDLRLKLPRSKPLFRGFERPSFSRIAILTILCLVAYPAFYVLAIVAKDRSLFIVRAIVSVWCSGIGFALGYVLLTIGAQHLEAATWATVIHMSREGGGMKLGDLARSSRNPTSFMPAFHVFRSRFRNRETSRRSRKSYDKRPWSLFLAFFVVLAILVPLLPFLFGRIMVIETFISNQKKVYREVLIAGDLTPGELYSMELSISTLLYFGGSTSDTAQLFYGNDAVFFAEPSLSQFVPGGSGAGTMNINQFVPIGRMDTPNNTLAMSRSTSQSNTGVVLRYPQWGIRIQCQKLPNPEVNLVPPSNGSFTYVFIPKDFLEGLFRAHGMELPRELADGLDVHLQENDTVVPSNIDLSTIASLAAFEDSGKGVSLFSQSLPHTDPTGWTIVETILLRLDTEYAGYGRFPVHASYSNTQWGLQNIGYDAAVCVQRYEPWIIEAYNTSFASPAALRIAGKGNDSTPLLPSGNIRGVPLTGTRYLSTVERWDVFLMAYLNCVGRVERDGNYGHYMPSPTAVSFTEGTGLDGYTELSPHKLTIIRAQLGAANTLPYFAGSGPVVAQSYEDETLAFVTYRPWQLISLSVLVWILGIIGELFVPALPLDVPRREFGLYSWLALFQSQELQIEAADDLDKLMHLDELEEKLSGKRVKFVAEV